MNTDTLIKIKTDLLLKGTASYKGISIALANAYYQVRDDTFSFFIDSFDKAIETADIIKSLPNFCKAGGSIFIQQENQISYWNIDCTYEDVLALKEIIANPPNQLGRYYETGLERLEKFKNSLVLDPSKPIQTIFHNKYYLVSATRNNLRVNILGTEKVIPLTKSDHIFWLLANVPEVHPVNFQAKPALYLYLRRIHENSEEIS